MECREATNSTLKENGEAIRIVNFTYKYPGAKEPALKNINLVVHEGEVLAIMGPNGAGKTTLCYAITGLLLHFFGGEYYGDIYVKGKSVFNTRLEELITDIGIVFQEYENQIIGSTVKDDVSFGPLNLGLSRDEVEVRVREALKAVNLLGFEHREVHTLSGGEKQRLAIAGVLAVKPKIIVLDEPFSQLDHKGRLEVISILEKLKRIGHTIILTEHRSEEVCKLADRVIVLYKGRVVLNGSTREVFSKINLLKRYGVKPLQVTELALNIACRVGAPIERLPIDTDEVVDFIIKLVNNGILKFASRKLKPHYTHYPKTERSTIIEVQNLHYTYPNGVKALNGVNLKVYEGEFLAIIGQNGSGKTTLIKHFNGLLKPTHGVVKVFGIDTRKCTVAQLSRIVGLVFQNPDYQLFTKSVRDEIVFSLKNMDLPRSEIESRVSKVLELTELKGYENVHPLLLSKSERQKLALASIIAMDPKIIVVDEPTTGQDYKGTLHILELLKKLNQQGKTIIIVTHDLNIVLKYAHRVVILHQGRIVLDGPPRDVFSKVSILEKLALIPPQVVLVSYKLSRLLRKNNTSLTLEEVLNTLLDYRV